MKVAVIGCGYVGLVSGAGLAHLGHDVLCIDKDAARVADLEAGRPIIYEPDLDNLIVKGRRQGRLKFGQLDSATLGEAEIVLIAVGTPSRPDGDADLGDLFAAITEIAPLLQPEALVMLKSTVPVGSQERAAALIAGHRGSNDIAVVSNPEFLREGSAVADFLSPEKLVIGAAHPVDFERVEKLYAALDLPRHRILRTTPRSAELGKYASNAFLAVKLSYANELADLCARLDADFGDVAISMGLDSRIGKQFLACGPGYGGSCFPKDTRALSHMAKSTSHELKILEAAMAVNDERAGRMIDLIEGLLSRQMKGATIAVLGLTFKANTGDIRESPAMSVVRTLLDRSAKIRAYDPAGMPAAMRAEPRLMLCETPYEAAANADLVVVLTEWEEFTGLAFGELALGMAGDTVLDLRNILPEAQVVSAGLRYRSLGRAPAPTRARLTSRESRPELVAQGAWQ